MSDIDKLKQKQEKMAAKMAAQKQKLKELSDKIAAEENKQMADICRDAGFSVSDLKQIAEEYKRKNKSDAAVSSSAAGGTANA